MTLSAAHDGQGGLAIAIRDTGIGMSAPQIDIALTPFGQVDSHIARRNKGTGLGLPISRALIALHGGELRIDSTPGAGTRVTVALPQGPRLRRSLYCVLMKSTKARSGAGRWRRPG